MLIDSGVIVLIILKNNSIHEQSQSNNERNINISEDQYINYNDNFITIQNWLNYKKLIGFNTIILNLMLLIFKNKDIILI
jgi:hypothetical protein